MFRVNRSKVAPVLAEFLGAGTLVMIALILGQTTAVSYFIATSLAVTSAAVFLLFNLVSGAHANPAVTFGMWTARKIGTLRGISYVAAQMLGGAASWQLFQYLTNHAVATKTNNFTTPIFLAEVVGTSLVAMAYAAALKRRGEPLQSSLLVGAAYFTGIVVAATASAGYINPAVALGSRAWSANYVLGPLVGGLIGVNLYNYLFSATTEVEASAAATTSRKRTEAKKSVTVRRTTARRRKTSR